MTAPFYSKRKVAASPGTLIGIKNTCTNYPVEGPAPQGQRTKFISLIRIAMAESDTPNCWANDTRFRLLNRVHRASASSRSSDSFGA